MTIALFEPVGHAQHTGAQSVSTVHAAPDGTSPHLALGKLQSPAALDVEPSIENPPPSKPPTHAMGACDELLHATPPMMMMSDKIVRACRSLMS